MIRVLIVDDQPDFREMLEFVLSREEQIAVAGSAGDGAGALTLVEELEPDVVLMDIAMPGMDGFEATRRIHELRPQTAVLVLSGSGADEDVDQARAAGAVGFVTKSMLKSLPEAVLAAA